MFPVAAFCQGQVASRIAVDTAMQAGVHNADVLAQGAEAVLALRGVFAVADVQPPDFSNKSVIDAFPWRYSRCLNFGRSGTGEHLNAILTGYGAESFKESSIGFTGDVPVELEIALRFQSGKPALCLAVKTDEADHDAMGCAV